MALLLAVTALSLTGCGSKKDAAPPTTSAAQQDNFVADLLGKGKKVEGMSYDYVLTSGETKMLGKVWMENSKIKTETEIEGHKMITFFDSNVFYTYDPVENVAIKISSEKGKKVDTPLDYSRDIDSVPDRLKVLEKNTQYEGVDCTLVTTTSPDGKEQSKIWLRRDYGVPVRVELSGADGVKTVMEYKNMKIGPQSPGIFKLPEGAMVTDMDEMMKQGSKQ